MKLGKEPSKRWSLTLEARHQIVFATFLATFTAYVERVGFSIAFTSMAKDAGLDESVKGTVLSAFFWGYGVSQIPGGWAAQLYGGRIMLCLSFGLWSLASVLTPQNAANTLAIILARVCVGVAQGFLIPAVHTVLSQWIPPHERARAVSLTTSGMYMGSAAAMLLLPGVASVMGASYLLRLNGYLGLSWLGLWLLVGREVPHRETLIPISNSTSGPSKGRTAATPWRRMMRSTAVWAIVVNNFAFHYGFYVVMNWLPTYFNSVLKTELSSLGPLKTLPYLVMFATSNFGALAGDALIRRRHYSTAAARKTVNTLGFVAAAGSLMLMPAARGVSSGVIALTLTLGAFGFSRGGFSVNHMDIAPKYAGVLMGISNTAGTLSGVLGVALTGRVLDAAGGATNVRGWYNANALSAALGILAAAYFNLCAHGEKMFD